MLARERFLQWGAAIRGIISSEWSFGNAKFIVQDEVFLRENL